MKRAGSTTVLLLLVGTIMGCDSEPIQSIWTHEPPVIDGSGNDWESTGFTFLDDIRGAVAVANDDTMLYLLIRYRDQELARKASVGGFTLWWGLNGEKRPDIGVQFPGRESIDDMVERMGSMKRGSIGGPPSDDPMEQGSPPDFGQRDNGDIHGDMEIVFGDIDSPIPILEIYADAAFQYYKGSFIYEFAIPLSAVQGYSGKEKTSDISDITFNATLGGLSDADLDRLKESMPEGKQGGPPGGMGGPGGGRGGRGGGMGRSGGGMGGRGGGGPMGQQKSPDEMFSSEEIWFKVHLSEDTSTELEDSAE